MRTAYDQQMDDLLRRMSNECDGEEIGDVMNACAVMIGIGLRNIPPELHESIISRLLGFVHETCDGKTEPKQH
jgi:hypothetical protein